MKYQQQLGKCVLNLQKRLTVATLKTPGGFFLLNLTFILIIIKTEMAV